MPARAWSRLRLAILERDGWRCTRCGGIRGRLEVHHLHGPGDNRPEALTTYCRSCHIEVHRPPVAPDVAAWRDLLK